MARGGRYSAELKFQVVVEALRGEHLGRLAKQYSSRHEARSDVFDYIERFYNPRRRHELDRSIRRNWLNGKVYFNGRHVWQNTTNGNFWRHGDHLGSARLRTDGNGASLGLSRYYPFGEEIEFPTSEPNSLDNYQFTGKERDVETGLDNFIARMCSPELARFLSIDPARESFHPENPQTWNRYTYVLNNPMKFADPDGRSAQLAETAKFGAAASAISGPQQPFVIVGTAVVVGLLVAQNPDVQAAFSEAVEGVRGLFSTEGGDVTSDGLTLPGTEGLTLRPAIAHNKKFVGTQRNPDGSEADPMDKLNEIEDARNTDRLSDYGGTLSLEGSRQRAR